MHHALSLLHGVEALGASLVPLHWSLGAPLLIRSGQHGIAPRHMPRALPCTAALCRCSACGMLCATGRSHFAASLAPCARTQPDAVRKESRALRKEPCARRHNVADSPRHLPRHRSTVLAVAGPDYSIVAGDTRMSTGFNIKSRNVTKIFKMCATDPSR